MAYHNSLFPAKYARQFVGGLVFPLRILSTPARREKRIPVRTQPYVEFRVDQKAKQPTDFTVLRNFWAGRGGGRHSFPFKDWNHYSVTDEQFAVSAGSATTYQLTITYGDAGGSTAINVTKPVSPVVIKVAGSTKTEGVDYTLNYLTGVLTWLIVPANGLALTWSGTFYWPVRFDMGKGEFTFHSLNARSWLGIVLVGVPEE